MTIIEQIRKIRKNKITYLTTPSHGQKSPYKSVLGKEYYSVDYSEVDGLNEESVAAVQKCFISLAKTYDSKITVPLTNGSTQGVLAAMISTLKDGDKVLIARNCHKSVHNGLILTGAMPVWIMPPYDEEFSLFKSILPTDVENAFKNDPSIKAVIITSPTYDGIISNVEKIAAICKEHGAILIVDEAHGALWNFDKSLGTPAILAGADISIQSLHKNAGAVAPCALLHVSKTCPVDFEEILHNIELITTTSIPLPLFLNIEENVNYLNSKKGKKDLEKLTENIYQLHQKISNLNNVKVFKGNNDPTKIVIGFDNIASVEACSILYETFKIECEICGLKTLTFLTGIGTTAKKLNKLYKGLKYIDKFEPTYHEDPMCITELPRNALAPRIAFKAPFEAVSPENAVNEICAECIVTYPPGIPLISYGEIIHEKMFPIIAGRENVKIVKR